MEKTEIADISVGTGILASLGRIDEKTEQLFREFIDNSTSSFKDHEDVLKKYSTCCKVTITWTDDEIIIQDNAYGMNEKDFLRALKLNAKAEQYSETSRSKYGLGLKYAAANLGDWYQIETIEFKSCQKFTAVVDIEDLEKNNPDKLKWTRADVSDDLYGTKITIRKLHKKLNTNSKLKNKTTKLDELVQNLSMIYSKDLRDRELLLSINDVTVQYTRPEIWENENGNQYYCIIKENSFKHGGKIYKYTGWAAIRKRADSGGAGFTLMQKDRAINLHYLPEDLFGKHNDFRYQRVFGEINLIGDSWTVTFTKNAVKWENNGLEESFISALLNNDDLRYILDKAKKLRKDPADADKLLGGNTAKPEATVQTPTPQPAPTTSSDSIPNNNTSNDSNGTKVKNTNNITDTQNVKPDIKSPNNTKPATPESGSEPGTASHGNSKRKQHEFVYNKTKYLFNIDTNSNTDPKGNWLQISVVNEKNNEYNLDVNLRTTFLKKFKREDVLSAVLQLALVLVVAQLESKKIGLSLDLSKLLIDKVNEILKTENPFK